MPHDGRGRRVCQDRDREPESLCEFCGATWEDIESGDGCERCPRTPRRSRERSTASDIIYLPRSLHGENVDPVQWMGAGCDKVCHEVRENEEFERRKAKERKREAALIRRVEESTDDTARTDQQVLADD